MGKDSLRIATEYYYWRPSHALLVSLQLEEYASIGVCFRRPIMDLGCGDGAFAAMLQESGILDSFDVALDHSMRDIHEFRKHAVTEVVQGDARALPLKNECVASVVSNSVISSIPTEDEAHIDRVFSEVHRVLDDQGLFVLTVATSRFNQNLVVPKVLRRLGASGLATRYGTWIKRGVHHYQVFDEEGWLKKLREAHFHIEQVRFYFTLFQARWWNFFTLPPFWLLKRLRFLQSHLKIRAWCAPVARIVETTLRPVFVKEQPLAPSTKQGQAGYLLIVARKRSVA